MTQRDEAVGLGPCRDQACGAASDVMRDSREDGHGDFEDSSIRLQRALVTLNEVQQDWWHDVDRDSDSDRHSSSDSERDGDATFDCCRGFNVRGEQNRTIVLQRRTVLFRKMARRLVSTRVRLDG